MKKRGLSTVVTSLILILLVLVAIGVVWVVVEKAISGGVDNIILDKFTADLEIKDVQVNSENVSVDITRNPGKGDLVGIKFIINDGLNSYVTEESTPMKELDSSTFIFNYIGLVKKVSIAPIYKTGSGKKIVGNVADTFIFNKQPTEYSENITKISINYSNKEGDFNMNLFGEGIEVSKNSLSRILTKTGYNQTYWDATQTIGFTNMRFGGGHCEGFNWSEQVNNITSPLNYNRWTSYARDATGQNPTLCVRMVDPKNASYAADWVYDANIVNGYGIEYWEMGNEDYTPSKSFNGIKNATEYAFRAKEYCQAMKNVDPMIKCGIVLSAPLEQTGVSTSTYPLWNDEVLSIAVSYMDFAIYHYYSPRVFVKHLIRYSGGVVYLQNFTVQGDTDYAITISAKASTCNEAENPYPILRIIIDENEVFRENITSTTLSEYTSSNTISLLPGEHDIAIQMLNDYWNPSNGCDINLYLKGDFSISNLEGTETVPIILNDEEDWTYSFFGSAENKMRENLQNISSTIEARAGKSIPIFMTEYGFHYGSLIPFSQKEQYEWRSNLFYALTLINFANENIPIANIWADTGTGYWRYVSSDGNTRYPIYHIINLFSNKTGTNMADYNVKNMPKFNSSTSISSSAPPVENASMLAILPTYEGNNRYLAIANMDIDKDEKIQLNISGLGLQSVTITTLSGDTLTSHPYKDGIEIKPFSKDYVLNSNTFDYTLKKHSLTFFEFKEDK